uniref:Uncharacterized protein n=1 Tax=Percolomonas cosmopolitus TaxID=63605 RepID=A0A7S1PEV3_9EUKA|eukprot:CAMPEP_0117446332 /NCGR_PEP_ID=MMETSP0759-20121206/6285_1 /TAXON_ID=63605 /ORGANISM="Percolomonas cosmopolitus, Strain WS" /LENGTH=688 /DNA_ID=CAMNT_0005238593 /DNA_START=347 /DNA_END=2410 /DNA_ORIENTATION=-
MDTEPQNGPVAQESQTNQRVNNGAAATETLVQAELPPPPSLEDNSTNQVPPPESDNSAPNSSEINSTQLQQPPITTQPLDTSPQQQKNSHHHKDGTNVDNDISKQNGTDVNQNGTTSSPNDEMKQDAQASTSTDAAATTEQQQNTPMEDDEDESATFTSIEDEEREMMKELIEGQHISFLDAVRKMKKSHNTLQEISGTHKNQKINAVKNAYQSEIDLIHNWFIEEKKNIQREMISQLRKKLEILNREQQSKSTFQRKRLRSHVDPYEEALGRKRARKTPTALWNAHFMKFKRSPKGQSFSAVSTITNTTLGVNPGTYPATLNKNQFPVGFGFTTMPSSPSHFQLQKDQSTTSQSSTSNLIDEPMPLHDHTHENIYFALPQLPPISSKEIDEDVQELESILKDKTAESDIVQDEGPDEPSADELEQQQLQQQHAAFLAIHQQQLQQQMLLQAQHQQAQQNMVRLHTGGKEEAQMVMGGGQTTESGGNMHSNTPQQQQTMGSMPHTAAAQHRQQQMQHEVYYLPSAQHILSNTSQFDTNQVDNRSIPSIDRMTSIPLYPSMVGSLDQCRIPGSTHFSPQSYIQHQQAQHYLTTHGAGSGHPPPPQMSPSVIPPNVNVTFPFHAPSPGHWPAQPQQMNGTAPSQQTAFDPRLHQQHSPHSETGVPQTRLPPMEHQQASGHGTPNANQAPS